ncbi:MAG: 50S ribosomal protein L11 methyltransferase [Acidobacteriota bacterium]
MTEEQHTQRFYCVEIGVPAERGEALAARLQELDPLGWEERSEEGKLRLFVYFSGDAPWERWRLATAARLRGVVTTGDDLRFHRFSYDAAAWLENYKRTFTGLAVPPHFWIHPPWEPDNPDYQINLCLEPGHGFGTGTHESTRLALQLLAGTPSRAGSILDVGTGSGILSIAAAKLHPDALITALDIDPLAADDAAKNRGLNPGVHFAVIAGGPEVVRGPFDLVLANLTGPILRRLSARLARLSAGQLILSGMTADEAAAVCDLYTERNWTVAEEREENSWVAARLERCTG